MVQLIVSAVLLLVLSENAQAHFVWLERDGDGPARAYFGEWIDDIREKTGGLLDRFKAPRAFLGTSNEPLPVKRNDNNLEINAKGRGDVRFVDSSVPSREDKEKGGATKTIYYAKAGRAEIAAKLDLELVPTAANGNTFVLVFLGAPLPKAELTIIGPSKWEKPLVTDEQGRVTLPTPWAGRYVLEVAHFDEKAGGSGEEKYSRTRHISSLSFVQQSGIRWTEKRKP
ncbi:MAG TPA: DUF4198 domain-containing protein [Candidatus Binatia bacterium]|jgi:uncharacterized GH25 family protein|nr:DUF4198 domain-containing protein [Candidatus Binatia bacterium]